jgi:hypothetical protein
LTEIGQKPQNSPWSIVEAGNPAPHTVPHPRLKTLACSLILAAAVASVAHAQTVTVNVDTTTPIRLVDEKVFGLNTAVWDSSYPDPQTVSDLQDMQVRVLRYPGGSSSDDFNWQNNTSQVEGQNAGATTFDIFAASALSTGAQVIITVNYGTGTADEAAAWVKYSNVTKSYGFKYWEIGNECYGLWEEDTQAQPHDPVTYATRAVQYIQEMKKVDPTVKIGVVADSSEDSYQNGYNHVVTNPMTGVNHSGWTPVMLATMKSLGVLPDFLIYHSYAQNPGSESDSMLLQESALVWPSAAAGLRSQLTDYLGSSGASIQLLVTENNSVSTGPGKQSVSLVNGLFMADSIANVMQTEFNSLIWWDMYNGPGITYNNGTANVPVNLSASLYGWRMYGDYGVENGEGGALDPTPHDRYPTYYVMKLLSDFARGGDTVVNATSNNTLLSTYAVHRQDGSLTLLAINKSPTATYNANIAIKGYAPQATATVYSYGIPQDEYSEENAQSPGAPPSGYSWENSLDGWVNQSGPDVAPNYGLVGPFLYSLAFSTTTGVTNGSYSLACATTAANPGDSAVIQNSTPAIGTAFSTASSVSVDIYPEIAAGNSVQASIYINGSNISINGGTYVLLGTVTLNPNQENTATFTLTAQERAGISASLGSGNWFQVGININATAPLTVYFDNFTITPLAAPTPTPTPTPIAGAASSPDLAVSTISNAGASFSASFAPYSATVISLNVPSNAPAATSQPSSQTVASGSTAVFSFTASGAPTPTYQWFLNGTAIPSGTSSTLVVSGATSANAGSYTCTATNSSGSVTSNAAALGVINTSDPGRLVNISCRATVGTGPNILIAGFVVGGAGTTGSEPLLIRGSGPALVPLGVTGALPDPQLQLYRSNSDGSSTLLATNNGWAGSSQIASTAAMVGAFPWTNDSSHDSALLETLSGAFTTQIAGQAGDTGVALAEVYDATPSGTYTLATPRIINISARVQVGTGGNILISGFVVGGSTSRTVLIRASGPALVPLGVTGTLADPQLLLYRSNSDGSSTLLYANSGWAGNAQIALSAASVGAFPWGSLPTKDSAILVTLPPGGYTAQVSGASGDTGVALVEVYEVP